MGLAEITVGGVRKALAEFDQIGREEFLKKYGFGRSRTYFLVVDGRRYDSKAIAGAAYSYDFPDRDPLTRFSGGDKRTAHVLRGLGFAVPGPGALKERVLRDDGTELDAAFSIETDDGETSLVYESSGGTRGSKYARNLDYDEGLELLFSRLGELGCSILNAYVDSTTTRKLPLEDKRLIAEGTPYPVPLQVADVQELRRLFGSAQASTARAPGAKGRGNSRKRVRFTLGLPPEVNATGLLTSLVGQASSRAYYAFLANPDRYRIEEAVHELDVDTWVTRGQDMKPGDRVIIWKAKGSGNHRGIVALGEVISEPESMSDADNPFWNNPPDGAEERVHVRYSTPEGLPLWLGGEHDDVLDQLSVSRGQGTVFNVTADQWQAVVKAAGGEATPTWKEPDDDDVPPRRRSQGRGLSPGKRKAIEMWAVNRAKEHYPDLDLVDVGSTKSWDLEDEAADQPVRIEVKGSRLSIDKITLTDNEVVHARGARDGGAFRLILVVVDRIHLEAGEDEDEWIASGGKLRVIGDPWEIDDDGLEPVQWRYEL